MSIENTFLDFKSRKTFVGYKAHMNEPKQQAMFKEIGIKNFIWGNLWERQKERP